MLDTATKKAYQKYRRGLPDDVSFLFSWSGRLLMPRVLHDAEVVREAFGRVEARTWTEAAILLALAQEDGPPERWVDDVIFSRGGRAAMAWRRRKLGSILDNLELAREDCDDSPVE